MRAARLGYDTLDFEFELKSLNDEGELEGYAAVFGNLDLDGDIIEPGAFTKSIQETGMRVPVLHQHDRFEPIGVSTELVQDRKGLAVKAQLNMDVQRARETRALLNQGAMQGLSIGYRTIKKKFEGGARKLQELALKEFSAVTFPANTLAVAKVKAAGDVIWDPETTLDALRSALSSALNPAGVYNYYIRDIAADGESALVSCYSDEYQAWVVPFEVDDDGELTVSPSSDWTPAEQVWVQADDDVDDPAKSEFPILQVRAYTLQLGEAKQGRVFSPASLAALTETRDRMSALLDLAEPAKEATPPGLDEAAIKALTPADEATLRDLFTIDLGDTSNGN